MNALVYPLPHTDQLGLGVHLTRTLWGTVLVGPTARYIEEKNDYERDRLPLEEFLHSARVLVPELEWRICGWPIRGYGRSWYRRRDTGSPISSSRETPWPRMINLVGIESPGLTSAPAIARHVAALVAEILA